MKKDTKKIFPVVALSAVAIAGLVGINGVLADDNDDPRPLSEKIAEYFNLDVNDVEGFFESEREERQAEMQQVHEERLSKLVEEGKITEEQKQLILDKQAERRAQMEADREPGEMREMTQEEREAEREGRRAEAEERRTEMEQWLEDNGISTDLMDELGFGGGFGHGNGGSGRGGFGGPVSGDNE